MKYSYHIVENDYYEFNKYHLFNTPLSKRRMMFGKIFVTAFILFMALIVGLTGKNDAVTYSFFGFCLVVILLYNIFFRQFMYFSIKRNIKKMKKTGKIHYDKEITSEFLEDSFAEKTADSESLVKYTMLAKIATGTNAFYLYVNVQSALIVPFRVFADENEKSMFFEFIQSKITANGTEENNELKIN